MCPSYEQNFYQNRIGQEKEKPFVDFKVDRTTQVSPTLAFCKAVDPGLVALWTRHWKASGFFV